MKFPTAQYSAAAGYFADYASALKAALDSIDREAVSRAAELLAEVRRLGGSIWSCGNGGSAAIANHLACDHGKGIHHGTGLRASVHSLSANVEIITAIGNDLGYVDIFAHQLRLAAKPGDVLVTISASGDSENIVQAVAWARANGLKIIALTGFSGGRSAALADVNVHVAAGNYGIVEDAHQSVMHALAQYLRQAAMSAEQVKSGVF